MKVVETCIYIAHDGTKFFTAVECRDYEKSKVEKAKRARWIELRYCDFLNNRTAWAKGKIIHEANEFTIVGNFSIYCNISDGHTVITNLKTGRSGKSVCSNRKFFDNKIGTAIAWARYLGMEIPDYI